MDIREELILQISADHLDAYNYDPFFKRVVDGLLMAPELTADQVFSTLLGALAAAGKDNEELKFRIARLMMDEPQPLAVNIDLNKELGT
jgi:hypothetical protein